MAAGGGLAPLADRAVSARVRCRDLRAAALPKQRQRTQAFPRKSAALHRPSLLLLQLGRDATLLQAREVVDENLSLQVIDLVLDTHRQQTVGFEIEQIAFLVEGTDLHPFGALYPLVDAGYRQATLFVLRLPTQFHDLRVDKHPQVVVGFRKVYDDHLRKYVDLWSSETNSGGGIHGVRHVPNESADVVVNAFDRSGSAVEAFVRIVKDRQQCHAHLLVMTNLRK